MKHLRNFIPSAISCGPQLKVSGFVERSFHCMFYDIYPLVFVTVEDVVSCIYIVNINLINY